MFEIRKNRARKLHEWILEDYLEHCKRRNRSENTIASYRRDLQQFIQWVEVCTPKNLSKITAQDIESYMTLLYNGQWSYKKKKMKTLFSSKILTYSLKAPLAVASRKRHLSSLKNFYAYCTQKYPYKRWWQGQSYPLTFKEIPINPMLHQIRLKDGDYEPTPLVTKEHWESLMSIGLSLRERLLLSLMYWGGLRLSEAKNLRIDQLDHDTNILSVVRKGGKRHQFFIHDDGKLSLWWQAQALQSRNEYLFASSSKLIKAPITRRGAYKLIKKAFMKAGLPKNCGPHGLRKACATRLYYQTKDLLFVRDYLNHKDAKVTQRYIEIREATHSIVNTHSIPQDFGQKLGEQARPSLQ